MNCGLPLLDVKRDWPLIMDFTGPGWGDLQGLITVRVEGTL